MFKIIFSAALFAAATLHADRMLLYRLPGDGKTPAYVLADELGFSAHGRTSVKLGGKYGYVDDSGKTVIPQRGPFAFTEARTFSGNGLAVVQFDDRYGYINREGQWAIPPKFDSAEDFAENTTLAVVSTNGLSGLIDKSGREVLPIRYEIVKRLDADRYAISDGSGWALADREAKLLTPFHFQALGNRLGNGAQDRVPAQKAERWGFIDAATGQFVVPPHYDDVGRFSEGFANFSQGGKIGYVDLSGRLLVEPRFERGDEFSEGLAAVQLDGRWGYIDAKGQLAIEPAYARAYKFSEGTAAVRQTNDALITINRRGEVVPEPAVDSAPLKSTEQLRAELGLVTKPCSATVRWDHLNLGAELKWDGESRASGVRIFALDTKKTLVWDAEMDNGMAHNGIFLVNGQAVLFGATLGIRLENWEQGLSAALLARQKQLTATPAEAPDRQQQALKNALTAILADLEKIDALERTLFFGVDHDAVNATHAAMRRIDKARAYVDAVKAITTKIDHAFKTLPHLSATQRTMLDNIRRKQAATLHGKLQLP